MQLYSLPDVVELLGVPYHRIYYAILKGAVSPMQSGRVRLFDARDIKTLKAYFAAQERTKAGAC